MRPTATAAAGSSGARVSSSWSPIVAHRLYSAASGADAVKYLKDKGAFMLDCRFTDLYGTWHHVQVPTGSVSEDFFDSGIGFDGSSLRGWQTIDTSDMTLIPDKSTLQIDPFSKNKTAAVICDVHDPVASSDYSRDPRNVAKKAIKHMQDSGIAYSAKVGPEAEFYVFDHVSYSQTGSSASYEVRSEESVETSPAGLSRGFKIRKKEGYFPVRPADSLEDLRTDISRVLSEQLGIQVEASHHEVGSSGQCEVNTRWNYLLEMADELQWFKYVCKNVGFNYDKVVTFMPKPIDDDNGSGMHCHFSLHDEKDKNLFIGDKYAGLSQMALHFIGGIIKNASALAAFTNPTINSYRRLVPGFEAPIYMTYSGRNRSSAIRIPVSHEKARRVEFRAPDPSTNPYLGFAAILMAGLDGIENKIDPGKPADFNLYEASPEQIKDIVSLPASLDEAIDNLEANPDFLLKGDVFTQDLIDMWVERKRELEITPMRKKPTAFEFDAYLDC